MNNYVYKMEELSWESYPLTEPVKVRVILFRECDNKVCNGVVCPKFGHPVHSAVILSKVRPFT